MADVFERLKEALSDRYTIERELGQGGMATVYLAQDLKLHREVALKVLRPDLAAALGPERFLQEVDIAAKLTHPHILPLHDCGEADGFLFYVMPYIEGESLREKLAKEGELPVSDAVRILKEVVDALAEAHSRGVVHRDIKPDNVMLRGRHALVTDFGVAKAVSEATGRQKLTTAGVALGTPAYMAPEQAAADPHIDHRADIYAVGAVAYELLTGRPPFTGTTQQEILAAHVTQTPEPVTKFRESVPPALEQLVLKCLAKKAADRWQTAEELIPQLEALATPSGGVTPLGTQPVSGIDHVAAARRSHPVRVAVLFGFGAVVVLAVLYALVMQLGLPDWVLVAGVALVVLALPITMLTGHHERQRALDRTTGRAVPTPPEGVRHWFTWKKALIGGGVAAGGLALAAGGYMAMRNLGIGPVGTLVAAGRIEEGAIVILTDFADNTGDSSLALTVTDAFGIDLARSSAVSLMQPGQVRDAMQRMTLDPDSRLDVDEARELAIREGAGAVIAGEVNRAGGGYVLSARLLDPETGDVIEAFRETATDSTELIDAIDRLSKGFRERMGESLRTVRRSPRLAFATTSSLEALRKYTQGSRLMDREANQSRAIELFDEAVAIDTTFAAAYRKLGSALSNLGREPTKRNYVLTKAYELRDRLTAYERAMVASMYFYSVQRDLERAASTLRSYYESNPGHWGILNNLAVYYQVMRQWEEAEAMWSIAIDSGGATWQVHSGIVRVQVAQGKFEDATQSLERFAERVPGASNMVAYYRANLAASVGDYSEARQHVQALRAEQSGDRAVRAGTSRWLSRLARLEGKLSEAERYRRELQELNLGRGLTVSYLNNSFSLAGLYSRFRGESAMAAGIIEEALSRVPLDTFPPADRPYLSLASYYAMIGRPDLARQVVAEYEAEVDHLVRDASSFRYGVAGRIALAEGNPGEAIEQLREWDARIGNPVTALPDLARAYDAAGQNDSAVSVYERFIETPWHSRYTTDSWELAGAHKRLGELYESRGEQDESVEHYAQFVELWKDADPELQPQVEDVRRRIARLVGEPQR
jgi:tetratricopeptide (TPR) repeat protein/tRNA A-37 threonylcarbamoyl transferase component Bud32